MSFGTMVCDQFSCQANQSEESIGDLPCEKDSSLHFTAGIKFQLK